MNDLPTALNDLRFSVETKRREDRRRWAWGVIFLACGIFLDTLLTVAIVIYRDNSIRANQRIILALQSEQRDQRKHVDKNTEVIDRLEKEHDFSMQQFRLISDQIYVLRKELIANRSLQMGNKLEKAAASALKAARALETKAKVRDRKGGSNADRSRLLGK